MKANARIHHMIRLGLLGSMLIMPIVLAIPQANAQNLYSESRQRFDGDDLERIRQQMAVQEQLARENQALRNEVEALRSRRAVEEVNTSRGGTTPQPQSVTPSGTTVGIDTVDKSAPATPQPVDVRTVGRGSMQRDGDNRIGVSGGKIGESVITRQRLNPLKPLNEQRRLETPKEAEVQDFSVFATPRIRPRTFEKHDLVTIQIRESHTSSSSTSLSRDKEQTWDTEITALPNLDLHDIIRGKLRRGNVLDGATSPLAIDMEATREKSNSGSYSRNDRVTVELTAQVLEVKPNQNIVLEATRTIESGGQITKIVLTGTARMTDIDQNNAILSTKLANLKVRVSHLGELKDNEEDGVLTEVMDFIFDF